MKHVTSRENAYDKVNLSYNRAAGGTTSVHYVYRRVTAKSKNSSRLAFRITIPRTT